MRRVCLETDQNGRALQSLAPAVAGVGSIVLSGTSARVAIPSGAQVVRLAASGNCFFAFGDNSVTATSSSALFPSGVEIFSVKPEWTHVAAIVEAGSSGNFSINEMS